jgi:hypothetical protein
MRWLQIIVCVLMATPELLAGAHIGFGAEGGFVGAYRNDPITQSGYPTPDYLRSLGGHLRVPVRGLELAIVGMFEWRTILTDDALGPVNLAYDQVSSTASLRFPIRRGHFQWFVGGGFSGYRLRTHFSPEAGRVPPTIVYKVGGELEAGVHVTLPWHRADAGVGIRHSLIPDPRISGTLLWVGFTIWPQSP